MMYHVLDTVVLARDLDSHGLRRGDLGAVVEVFEPDGLEVEFERAVAQLEIDRYHLSGHVLSTLEGPVC